MTMRPSEDQIKNAAASLRHHRPGYVALLSVLLLSAIALVLSLSIFAIYAGESGEAQAAVNVATARARALACAEIALLRIKLNNAYTGNEDVTVDNSTCRIEPVAGTGDVRTVKVNATVMGATNRLQIDLSDVYTVTVAGWKEIP